MTWRLIGHPDLTLGRPPSTSGTRRSELFGRRLGGGTLCSEGSPLSDNHTGSNDPAKASPRIRAVDARKQTGAKKAGPSSPDSRWRIVEGFDPLHELTRSGVLLAVIGFAMLSKWSPQDVNALVALVLPVLYLAGSGRKSTA